MAKWLAGGLLSILLAQGPAQAIEVRVRLRKGLKSVQVSGLGLSVHRSAKIVNALAPMGGDLTEDVRITWRPDGFWNVKWNDQTPVQTIESDELWVRGQRLHLAGEPVPYQLQLRGRENGGVDIMARLDMESYLLGVLPAEMPAGWPLEALKAQAVAARSFVIRSMLEHRRHDYDVDSTIVDQVYKFLQEAQSRPAIKAKVERAVKETRGEVLIDSRRRVLKAYYSADCGCRTEDPRFVWGHADSFQSVQDPSCSVRQAKIWNLDFSRAEVLRHLTRALGLPSGTELKALHVGGRTPSGRVSSVVASFLLKDQPRATSVIMSSKEFRHAFGFRRILSTEFSLQWMGDRMQIRGTGFGHGVGMCQTGAQALAGKGMKYREILQLYYPKAQLWKGKTAI